MKDLKSMTVDQLIICEITEGETYYGYAIEELGSVEPSIALIEQKKLNELIRRARELEDIKQMVFSDKYADNSDCWQEQFKQIRRIFINRVEDEKSTAID